MQDFLEQKQTVATHLKSITKASKKSYNRRLYWGIVLFALLVLLVNYVYSNKGKLISVIDNQNNITFVSHSDDVLSIETLTINSLQKHLKNKPEGLIVSIPGEDLFVTLESENDYWEVLHFLKNRKKTNIRSIN